MWVIAVLAGLAGLIILVLCVPLDVAFNLETSGRPKFRVRLVWFFGLVSKELGGEKKKPEAKKEITEEKPKKKRGTRLRTIFQVLRVRGLIRQIKNFLGDILGQLKIRELIVDLRVGLDNPADMGFAFALMGSINPFLSSFPPSQVRVQPYFHDETVVEGYIRGALRLCPIRLVIPFSRFTFSLVAIRVVKILVVSKWKGKK